MAKHSSLLPPIDNEAEAIKDLGVGIATIYQVALLLKYPDLH